VTSGRLRQLPGCSGISQTWDPSKIAADYANLPDVVTREYRENDDDDKSIAAARINAVLTAGQ